MAKQPKAPTMEQRWKDEDDEAPFGFDPTTGKPNEVDPDEADGEEEAESEDE